MKKIIIFVISIIFIGCSNITSTLNRSHKVNEIDSIPPMPPTSYINFDNFLDKKFDYNYDNYSPTETISILFNTINFSQNFFRLTKNLYPQNNYTHFIVLESTQKPIDDPIHSIDKKGYVHINTKTANNNLRISNQPNRNANTFTKQNHIVSVLSVATKGLYYLNNIIFKGMYQGGERIKYDYFSVEEKKDKSRKITVTYDTNFVSKLKKVLQKKDKLNIISVSYAFSNNIFDELLGYKNKIGVSLVKKAKNFDFSNYNAIVLFAMDNVAQDDSINIASMEQLSKNYKNVLFIAPPDIQKRYNNIKYYKLAKSYYSLLPEYINRNGIELKYGKSPTSLLTPIFANILINLKNLNPMLTKDDIIEYININQKNIQASKLYQKALFDVLVKFNVRLYNQKNYSLKNNIIYFDGNQTNISTFDDYFTINKAYITTDYGNYKIEKLKTKNTIKPQKIFLKIDEIEYKKDGIYIFYTKKFYSPIYSDITKKLLIINTSKIPYQINEFEIKTTKDKL